MNQFISTMETNATIFKESLIFRPFEYSEDSYERIRDGFSRDFGDRCRFILIKIEEQSLADSGSHDIVLEFLGSIQQFTCEAQSHFDSKTKSPPYEYVFVTEVLVKMGKVSEKQRDACDNLHIQRIIRSYLTNFQIANRGIRNGSGIILKPDTVEDLRQFTAHCYHFSNRADEYFRSNS